MIYTIQVSDHPGVSSRVPSQEANESWRVFYYGPLESAAKAREIVHILSQWYMNSRVFQEMKMHYAILGMRED